MKRLFSILFTFIFAISINAQDYIEISTQTDFSIGGEKVTAINQGVNICFGHISGIHGFEGKISMGFDINDSLTKYHSFMLSYICQFNNNTSIVSPYTKIGCGIKSYSFDYEYIDEVTGFNMNLSIGLDIKVCERISFIFGLNGSNTIIHGDFSFENTIISPEIGLRVKF